MEPPRKSRVTIITPPDNPLRRSDHNNDNHKREQIRRDRRTTAHKPEYMTALRRARLNTGANEQVRKIILRVEQPLALQTAEGREALHRRLPWLSCNRRDDEDAYYAACHRPVKLLTTAASGGSWHCERIDPQSGEPCHVVNEPSSQTCHVCFASRYCPNLRPFYSGLARLRSAVHREIRVKSKRIVELDGELDALDEALGMANERLVELEKYIAEGGGGGGNVADDAPESLRMLDIDITQSGSWQRTDVRALVPDIVARQRRTNHLLREIRGELCIIVQALYETAAPTVQKVVRGHLLRSKFDSIRRAIIDKAENEAAMEIQRMGRSFLAKLETERRRAQRREAMRLRIQTTARLFLARQEYKRRHAAYIKKLRHEMAIRIQRLVRGWKAKGILSTLVVEKKRQIAEAERRKEAVAKDSSAVRIQCTARLWLARRIASQKRIELTLSSRLLFLLEKLKSGDGSLHSMLSEINDDYQYYNREMNQIVKREDETATRFIGKVLQERRKEYDEAWRQYHAVASKVECNGALEIESKDQILPDRLQMYSSALRESPPNDVFPPLINTPCEREVSMNWEVERMEELDLAGLSHTASHRFPGTSILCDVPQLLDDTLARLINAVAIRSFVPPSLLKRLESTAPADAFQYYVSLPPGLEKASIEAEARSQAKPIIYQLNQMGFVYIYDAMPRSNLLSLLESPAMSTQPSPAFISCCNDVLTYLERAQNVNTSTRGSIRALVSEFIESRQGIMNVERKMTPENNCKGCAVDADSANDDDSLPPGLFDRDSALSEPCQGSSESSALETDYAEAPHHDLSVADTQIIKKAQHGFEAELDGIVSVAIASTQHRTEKCEARTIPATRDCRRSDRTSRSSTPSAEGKRSRFANFKGGLFRQARPKKNCARPNKPRQSSKVASSKCWAVPYTDAVRQSYPKYVEYRSQKRLWEHFDQEDGPEENAVEEHLANLLDGLPDSMQKSLKRMFEKKRGVAVV